MKEFFELKPSTRLDPSHQTTNLNSGQIVQLAHAVELKVALVSYGMLEDLVVESGLENRARGAPVFRGRSFYPSQCGSTVFVSLALRSQYSLPRRSYWVTWTVWKARCWQQFVRWDRRSLVTQSYGEHPVKCDWGVSDIVTLREESQPDVKARKETCELSQSDRPNGIPATSTEEGGGYILNRCWLKLQLLLFLPLARWIFLKTSIVLIVRCASRRWIWRRGGFGKWGCIWSGSTTSRPISDIERKNSLAQSLIRMPECSRVASSFLN